MIPILYENTETAFSTNGLGRLRDCISCIATEERNGIYECDFEYPVSGLHYELIKVGRIIGVTHDDLKDIQPFDIVSHSKPLDGIVTFHCTHISYRQSFITYLNTRVRQLDSLAKAFSDFKGPLVGPANPFIYSSDKTSTGYLACNDGVPRSIRQMLGGIEGSILDTYGGEYEWDKWNVILHSARGVQRPFAIRYGVNMVSYNDELDASESFESAWPYWTDGEETVFCSVVHSQGTTPANHDETVPLDLSDKFENKPTVAQLETEAQKYINSLNPYLPTQTINVSFARLQDIAGYEDLSNLEQCELCDTIKVVFPDYGTNGFFKIVKTVWNVLEDRYSEMQLGALSATMSEALGISISPERSGNGTANIIDMIYPIGSIYMSAQNVDPNVLFSGTSWTPLENRFLLGAGSSYTAGDTGGSKDAIIPYHRHGVAAVSNAITGGGHSHDAGSNQAFLRYNYGTISTGVGERKVAATTSGNYTAPVVNNASVDWSYLQNTSNETHTHNLPAHNTDYVGTSGNITGANMPPYLVVYMWKRTA